MPEPTRGLGIRNYVGRYLRPPIAQLAEAADLKFAQSGFESLWGDFRGENREPFPPLRGRMSHYTGVMVFAKTVLVVAILIAAGFGLFMRVRAWVRKMRS